ncbi:MAG: 5-formyltetrahydrofolate cyclo-ligase [Desulfovibrio sp.]
MHTNLHIKETIRKAMRARRKDMLVETVHALSFAAQSNILEDKAWKNAQSVGLYVAVRHEVETGILMENAWSAGKDVYFPYTPPTGAGVMHLLPCASGEKLVTNHFGIPEPTPATCPLPEEGEEWVPDVIVVPGIAFDVKGRRVGSGGGYYDRLFAKRSMARTLRIGLAYGFQVLDEVPVEKWDAPMHAIATEEGLTWL